MIVVFLASQGVAPERSAGGEEEDFGEWQAAEPPPVTDQEMVCIRIAQIGGGVQRRHSLGFDGHQIRLPNPTGRFNIHSNLPNISLTVP